MGSLAGQAYHKLLERFIRAEYMPGDKLSENILSQELKMSRTPIRTALIRLIRKNYIDSVDKKGIYVKGFSEKTFIDNCLFLHDLQKIVLYQLIKKNNNELISQLKPIILHQIHAKEKNDYYGYLIETYNFIETIFKSYDNDVLLKAFQNIKQDSMRMSMIIYNLTKHQPHYSTINMFTALSQSLKAQNIDEVDQYLQKNHERIMQFTKLFNGNGDIFLQ
ncbi:GntR family transcriptional regulator [Bacillus sp. JJ722]|uniref:GntR family transcriptional regulator n=1 Tax=Bacillus sp. JJ722 TaxID=3122973 RepID=UPI00300007BD